MWRASRYGVKWRSTRPGLGAHKRVCAGAVKLRGGRRRSYLVAVEKRGRGSGRVRRAVIPDFKSATLNAFIKQHVAPGSLLYTDGLKTCTGLEEAGFKHIPGRQPLRVDLRKGAKSAVPLADRAIANLQQRLTGRYHGVSRPQLQTYLDEFVFRHNRRKQPMAALQTLRGLGTPGARLRLTTAYGAREIIGSCSVTATPNIW